MTPGTAPMPTIAQGLPPAVHDRRDPVARAEPVRPREALADQHLAGSPGAGSRPSRMWSRSRRGSPPGGRETQPGDRGLGEPGHLDDRLGEDPGLHVARRRGGRRRFAPAPPARAARRRRRAGSGRRRSRRLLRPLQGPPGGDRGHEGGRRAGHEQPDGEGLPADPGQVAAELAVERRHQEISAGERRCSFASRGRDQPVGHAHHPVGHLGDDGVVGDDRGRGAQFAVDALEGLEHRACRWRRRARRWARRRAARPGAWRWRGRWPPAAARRRRAAKGSGPCGRREPHAAPGPPPARWGAGDLGDQRDVLPGGQAGDEVVELEDEADVLAAVAGERPRRPAVARSWSR